MTNLPFKIYVEKVAQEADRIAYGPEEAARLIGYSRNGLRPYLASGELRSFKLGKKKRLITRSDLLAFLEEMAAKNAGPVPSCEPTEASKAGQPDEG